MSAEIKLDNLYIAKPCNARWEDMTGTDRVRMCSLCSKNVYSISDMTRREAEDFLHQNGLSVCMGYYRRSDGTILTDDCPVGLRRLRNGLRWFARAVAAFLGLAISFNGTGARAEGQRFGDSVNVWRPQQSNSTTRGLPPTPPPVPFDLLDLASKEFYNQLPQACRLSQSIVIAEYVGYDESAVIGYDHPPTATFRLLHVLKGTAPASDRLTVRYTFKDAFQPVQPEDWTWEPHMMPQPNTQYLLFFSKPITQGAILETYGGSFGRMEVNKANREAVNRLLSCQISK